AVLFVVELGCLIWFGGRYVLGWDSLVVWLFKARVAALHGGVMPVGYYVDGWRSWSHVEYPLLLPLSEAWLFDWANQVDEGLVRGLFAVFDAALLAAIYGLGTRLGGSRWHGALGMLLLLFVPQLLIGTGSTATAWTDFVLAVAYLVTAGYVIETVRHGRV